MSNRAIASILHLSKDTVNKYVNEYNGKRDELLRMHPNMDASEIIQAFIEKQTMKKIDIHAYLKKTRL